MPTDDSKAKGPRGAVGDASFPSTCWSRIIGRGADGTARDPDLEALLVQYWRPIHGYLSRRHRLGREEAADATQDFLLRILEGAVVPAADRRRGRFRAFIKRALDHHVIDRTRAARTAKRGGSHRVLSLDFDRDDDGRPDAADPDAATPEEALDTAWRRALVAGALDEVERALRAEGKGVHVDLFIEHYLESPRPSHQASAAKYDLRLTDVSNYLRVVKDRYRASLRRRIRETVSDDEEYRAELAWMFGPDADREPASGDDGRSDPS